MNEIASNSSGSDATVNSSVGTEEARNLDQMLGDIAALEALAVDWPNAERNAAEARAQAIDSLNAEAFRRLIRSLKSVPGLSEALRDAAQDEVVYTVLRRHGIVKPSMFERVEAALDTVRPMLASHGGNVELVTVSPPAVEVRFLGSCDGCPASALTFYGGVKKAIQEYVPEITEIKQVKGLGRGGDAETVHFASPFAAYETDGWSTVKQLDELPDGETIVVETDGHSVLLSRFGDMVTCFENSCAHMGLSFDDAEIENGIITCPYHGFQYALETGECLTAPEVALQPHAVRVKGADIDVRVTR